ncbi:uroporphyrinogen decarboxylase [candidate division KSB1 bacterium]|nr:uroporphyrinogen decarboxylase [candidate division KSB1 bacterium]
MTDNQWIQLLQILEGKEPESPPIGFIIDSLWLPGWYGISTLDYYTSDNLWFKANLKAVQTFPDVMFLPGFWSEYGMCTEPSAFGSRLVWAKQNLPHAEKVSSSIYDISKLARPNVQSDGLLPFVINRLKLMESKINDFNHQIRFAVARGPLNIASFLMGSSEFLTALMLNPDAAHELISRITDFTREWLLYQKSCFPSIDGILLLDDIVGFVGDNECREFVVPYVKKLFSAFDASVRFFHNDAHGLVCAPYLHKMDVNLFNFSYKHTLPEMRKLTGDSITLLGNIPPRDVLANGSVKDVVQAFENDWNSIKDKKRIIWSCGGGMPRNVSTQNIIAFVTAVKQKYE